MSADYQTIQAGSTDPRGFSMVKRADGSPITSGTVNYYLKALTGTNAGKWYRNSDSTWQASETASAMSYENADAEWSITLSSSPFGQGVAFIEYAKESGNLHIPQSRRLKADYTATTDSSGRTDVGKTQGQTVTLDANNVLNVSTKYIGGTAQTARDLGASVLISVGTSAGQINVSAGKVPATIAAGDIAADAIDANAIKTDAVTEIQSGMATSSGLSTVNSNVSAVGTVAASAATSAATAATAANAAVTAASGVPAALLATVVDGLSLTLVFKALVAFLRGKAPITDNGDGTRTIAFKAADGSTTALSVTYNATTGARPTTGTIS